MGQTQHVEVEFTELKLMGYLQIYLVYYSSEIGENLGGVWGNRDQGVKIPNFNLWMGFFWLVIGRIWDF